jgi:hypothetical protein
MQLFPGICFDPLKKYKIKSGILFFPDRIKFPSFNFLAIPVSIIQAITASKLDAVIFNFHLVCP